MTIPRMLLASLSLALLIPATPVQASEKTCTAAPSGAINVTVGNLLQQGDTPSCSLTFRCRNDRADCVLTAVGSVTGSGFPGVAVIVNDAAMAECWFGLGTCETQTATQTIAQGDVVTVTCVFRNGVSSDATVGCHAELV